MLELVSIDKLCKHTIFGNSIDLMEKYKRFEWKKYDSNQQKNRY